MTLQTSGRLHKYLRFTLITSVLAMASVGPAFAAPQVGIRAIESTYHQLLQALDQSRGTRPDDAVRQRITAAAQAFQDALKRDGGARANLSTDVRNIVASLNDGSYSAEGSINALRRDAKGSVIDAGAWKPSLAGTPIGQPLGTHLNQTSEGDCVGISVVRAFANTRTGAEILRRGVTANADGSFNVSLPGDPVTVYHLQAGDLDQYGKGDPPAAAVVGAMFQYFKLDPAKGSLPTNKVMELLAGQYGDHLRLADAENTPQGITDFLLKNASAVGSQAAVVFGGKPARNGDWSRGDGHAFAIIQINPATGLLSYTNPWNEGAQVRTIAISELARQAAGTSADFEMVTFR
ncbi:hypothetical protein RGV33_15095 [Pseudomonas sp. Bout1]|uniref:hypothetical protein n=1 Tax=Pseudomonas sp. Bout1 TaxID=3048600 RepID=UPI002AB4C6E5|nr:hypothetical protein [Pseudomonas sp. Bout1]MDY7532993.1 hypothetical protein [Pseudomonas sp. Bout1]MEB0185934.1 hypothetical protein [Pseudomonas sp. Bout1]